MTNRTDMTEFLSELDLHWFITFNFGDRVSQHAGDSKVKHFLNVLQDRAYGRRWRNKPPSLRITAVGLWEKPNTNPHLHVRAHLPGRVTSVLVEEGRKRWGDLVRRGQLDFSIAHDDYRVSHYMTKEWSGRDHQERLFIYVPFALGGHEGGSR